MASDFGLFGNDGPRKVLAILEDEIEQQMVLEDFLRDQMPSVNFTIADNGDRFQLLYETNEPTPGLVILDIRTPPPDGIDTLRWIKERYPDQKVVMFSSSLLEEDECLELGADGYEIKPEDLDDLGELIRKIVREHYPVDPLSSFPV